MKTDSINRLEKTYQLFKNCSDPNKRGKDNGWTIKEILGHLLDSASNNHQRLLRYVAKGESAFPAYNQEEFVKRANYKNFEYLDLLALWYNHNKLLFHIFESIPPEDLESTIKIGDKPALSIQQLMKDYFGHIENHENQVKQIVQEV